MDGLYVKDKYKCVQMNCGKRWQQMDWHVWTWQTQSGSVMILLWHGSLQMVTGIVIHSHELQELVNDTFILVPPSLGDKWKENVHIYAVEQPNGQPLLSNSKWNKKVVLLQIYFVYNSIQLNLYLTYVPFTCYNKGEDY